ANNSASCAPPQDEVGLVLFNGKYKPERHEVTNQPYENFTVHIPADNWEVDVAELTVNRFHMIGGKTNCKMKILQPLLGLAFIAGLVSATFQPSGVPFKSPVTVANGFSAGVAFSNLTLPRGIAFDSEENLLVIERGFGVTAFTRVTSPSPGFERTVVVQNAAVTHGILVVDKVLYVSTGTTLLSYPYNPSTKTAGTPTLVIDGIPGDGELTTHTFLIESGTGAFLVGDGPLTNIDPTARDPANGRAQIRRFVPSTLPLHWADGQVIVYGIRNPGGFAFDPSPSSGPASVHRLYVVENGASIDNVTGLTAQFVNDNPSDEINFVQYSATSQPHSYGFPDCAPLWNPDADPTGVPQYVGLPSGTQISLKLDPAFTDAWCRDPANNVPPVLDFQAHSVPLDIKFFTSGSTSTKGSFPKSFCGDAFVSFHGSFDRTPPTGYGVVRVPFPLQNSYSFLIQAADLTTCPGTCIRPAGLAFGRDGRLYVSSDSSGERGGNDKRNRDMIDFKVTSVVGFKDVHMILKENL
ncbi:hypothetical protein H0H93_014680, partial [Arthromyces matolae]